MPGLTKKAKNSSTTRTSSTASPRIRLTIALMPPVSPCGPCRGLAPPGRKTSASAASKPVAGDRSEVRIEGLVVGGQHGRGGPQGGPAVADQAEIDRPAGQMKQIALEIGDDDARRMVGQPRRGGTPSLEHRQRVVDPPDEVEIAAIGTEERYRPAGMLKRPDLVGHRLQVEEAADRVEELEIERADQEHGEERQLDDARRHATRRHLSQDEAAAEQREPGAQADAAEPERQRAVGIDQLAPDHVEVGDRNDVEQEEDEAEQQRQQ